MAIPDMPSVPPQDVPVMIAQANQAQTGTAIKTRVIGECSPSPSNKYSAENGLAPLTTAQAYFDLFEHRSVTGPATTTILQQPKHGVLRLVTEADRGTLFDSEAGPLKPDANLYAYLPEQGYLGKDSATILVDFGGGNQVKVKYFFQAINGPLSNTGLERLCAKTGIYWKISSTIDANGNSTITSVEYQSPATSIAGGTAMISALSSSDPK